jgi:sugar O-acyltransferase (sialic acid O-acetyltransferase NeuD family)
MKRLAIIGSGDLAQLITHHATTCGFSTVGYFNDFIAINETVNGIPVLGKINSIVDCYKKGLFDYLMCGIGYKHMHFRKEIFDAVSKDVPFANIIHPSCYVDPSVLLGSGVFLLPGCVLDQNVKLGNNVLLNTSCTIAHDSAVNDHSFLAPAVKIAGFTQIGEQCIIGIGTVIIDNLQLCHKTQTGAGAVVTKSTQVPGLYLGVPARLSRKTA